MNNPQEEGRYNEAHRAILSLKEIGSMVDAARTCVSRIRVTLADELQVMEYVELDPLYVQANKVDHEISELLDKMMALGIDCSPARS